MKSSTSLRNALLGATGFGECFPAGFKINMYAGAQPANPEDAATGTLLGTISLTGGAGALVCDAPANGVVKKPTAAVWACNALVAAGSMGYCRLYKDGDNPANASTTQHRIDFSVGVSGSGADLIVPSTTFAAGDAFQLAQFEYGLG
jgi:hypothetical protein